MSSFGGVVSFGKRFRRASIKTFDSSTLSVVCVSARLSEVSYAHGSRVLDRPDDLDVVRCLAERSWTSSCSLWRSEDRVSLLPEPVDLGVDLRDEGQVASTTCRSRLRASFRTSGETP